MCAQHLGPPSHPEPPRRGRTSRQREVVATEYPVHVPAQMWRFQVLQGDFEVVCNLPGSEGAQYGDEDQDCLNANTSEAWGIHCAGHFQPTSSCPRRTAVRLHDRGSRQTQRVDSSGAVEAEGPPGGHGRPGDVGVLVAAIRHPSNGEQ